MTAGLLGLYLAAMLAIGVFSRRRAGRTEESFYVADRSYGGFRGFVALAATTTGGSSTLVCAALVYEVGLPGIWLDLSGAIGLFLLGVFLAKKVRQTAALTLPEIAGRFYGPAARGVTGLLVVLAEIAWFALLIEATQTVLTAAFGLDPVRALILCAAVFIAYTAIGGQYAVIRTDLVQYILMVVGVLAIGVFFSLRAVHGEIRLPSHWVAFPTNSSLGWKALLGWLVLIGLPHLVGSDVYSKLLSCRDQRASQIAAYGAAGSKVVFGAGMAVVALCLRQSALALPNPDAALPAAIVAFAPGVFGALALVALIATMQSSSDAVLLTAAAATAHDVVPSVTRKPLGFTTAQILIPIYGALGLFLALRMREVIATLKLGYSFFAAGMILPILFGFFRKLWLPAADAIVAMLAGGAVAVAGDLAPRLMGGVDPVLAGTGLNLLILLIGIGRTRLSGKCPGDYGLTLRR